MKKATLKQIAEAAIKLTKHEAKMERVMDLYGVLNRQNASIEKCNKVMAHYNALEQRLPNLRGKLVNLIESRVGKLYGEE